MVFVNCIDALINIEDVKKIAVEPLNSNKTTIVVTTKDGSKYEHIEGFNSIKPYTLKELEEIYTESIIEPYSNKFLFL